MSTIVSGTLYLLPVGLSTPGDTPEDWRDWLPSQTREIACKLEYFVAENAKSARASLKGLGHPSPLRELNIEQLPNALNNEALATLAKPLFQGHDVGLMSEAGCPAVADPGALLVRYAHAHNIKVKPLVGPSALLLALMGSGLDGQRFAFHGYLPTRDPERAQRIQALEKDSARLNQTQLCIEAPYRNDGLFDSFIKSCRAETRLCVASDLTLNSESIQTLTIAQWKKAVRPSLDKRPTIFLILSGS